MKKIFVASLVIYLLAASGVYVQSRTNPCSRTITYSLGSYDPRFGLTRDKFLAVVQDMEQVWEEPVGKELFVYDPAGDFKINLVFDERMQKTLDEKELRQKIDLSEESYDKLAVQYNALSYQHKQTSQAYEDAKAKHAEELSEYNNEVAYWNRRGGAPAEDYKRLNGEKARLDAQSAQIDALRREVNDLVKDMNLLAERVNVLAKKLNKDVDLYNGKFGSSRRFDQGTYNGSSINIYQFNEESDLRLVVAHELGHALKLEHVADPKAIMHYLMDQQDLTNIKATDADISALRGKCGI